MFSYLLAFLRRRNGSVSVTAAVTIPVLIGFVALSADYGHGLVIKAENQRIADLAAYAGAVAYSSTSSTTTMAAVAQNVAVLNGLTSSQVSASLVASPRTATNMAVSVKVATNNVLLLAPVLRSGTSLPVSAMAYAEVAANAPACMIALNILGTGVLLNGGTSISAPTCSVASNSTVTVPCGDTVTAKSIVYNTLTPTQPCSGISGTISKAATTDPLASNAGVLLAAAHASSLSSLTSPSAPSVPNGTSISFTYTSSGSGSAQAQAATAGCTASLSSNTWTLTCPSGGTYYFGSISIQGGLNLNFNTSGSASTTYDFSGAISDASGGGNVLTFGPGTYNIAQGIMNVGGSTMTFGAGTFKIGQGTTCNYTLYAYSICNSGTLMSFGGPSTFVFSAGIYNAGGSTLSLGSGSTNSYNIGSSLASGGNAFNVGGGSKTTFADATGASSLFQFDGNFNVASGGGSCVTLGAASQHDFGGYFSTAGGTILGAGVYSVYGYIAFGANGGGDVSCNGTTVGVTGTNVTFVTAGASTSLTYPCIGSSFCIASGYNNVSLTAPTSGTYANLGVIGPLSVLNLTSAVLTEGASNTSFSGAFYFPNGPLTLSGGASIGNQAGQCLQIVASQITLTGGTSATASNCFSGSSSSSTVHLVQ